MRICEPASRALSLRLFLRAFIPRGSLSSDYYVYQFWDTVQAVASSVVGHLAQTSVLKGLGVGNAEASAASAAVIYMLRDASGMASSILFSSFRFQLDLNSKRWRLAADAFNDLAFFMTLVSSLLPPAWFLLCVCAASVMRAVVGVAGSATRVAIVHHQARSNNVASVASADGAQETAANLASLLFSLWLIPAVDGSAARIWLLYFFFTAVHLFSNWRAVRSVALRNCNEERANILIWHYLNSGRVLTPEQVSRRERVVLPWFNPDNITFVPADKMAHREDTSKKYLLESFGETAGVWIAMHRDATDSDALEAYFEAMALRHAASTKKPSYAEFSRAASEQGWQLLHPRINDFRALATFY